ncbi:MAG: hypothetical protein NC117_09455, partial [Pseudoflavonifractor sp.]|nr:hypothetical protein [Pseudoflavonifractor sp.]
MRTVIHHRPHSGERHIVAPNYIYGFSRWLKKTTGRTLCPPHRHIIEQLERTRLNAEPVPGTPRLWQHRPYIPARVIISDPAPGYTHISDLLVHYIHWLRTIILPHRRTLILDRTTTAARALVTTLPTPPSPHVGAYPGAPAPIATRALVTTLPTPPSPHVGAHPGAPAPTATDRRSHPAPKASETRTNCSSITSEARHGENAASQPRASERSANFPRATPPRPVATIPTRLHTIGSGWRPTTFRGGTFDIILLLNADTYPISGPRSSHGASAFCHPDALDSALDTFLPMLQPHRESILIIHGTPYPRLVRRRTPRRRTLRRHPSLTTLNSLTTLTTPPRYNPTPFLHYLTASRDGDLGPFTTIDPESPPRHSQRGSPHPSTAAPGTTPSGDKQSRRHSAAPGDTPSGDKQSRRHSTAFGDATSGDKQSRRHSTAFGDTPSGDKLSRRDSHNERRGCVKIGAASFLWSLRFQ